MTLKAFNQLYVSSSLFDFGKNPLELFNLPFLLEDNCWEFVSQQNDADIVFLLDAGPIAISIPKLLPHQVLVMLSCFHVDDHFVPDVFNLIRNTCTPFADNIALVHKNAEVQQDPFIYYDILFNRQKLYCTEFDKVANLSTKFWTLGTAKGNYALSEIKKKPNVTKFLSASLVYLNVKIETTYNERMLFRLKLIEFLTPYADQGHLPTSIERLPPNPPISEKINEYLTSGIGGYWLPIADHYYETSFVSIYVETLTVSRRARCVTEKTFDPMIKGNFILPFAYSGFISDLVNIYGFKFPKWIDYSYDAIEDMEKRFEKYLQAVEQVLSKDITELHNLYLQDKHILEHNRNVFFTRPYDSLYEKILKFTQNTRK